MWWRGFLGCHGQCEGALRQVRSCSEARSRACTLQASGFLVKDTEPADLITAVRAVAAGDSHISPSMTRRLVEEIAARAKPSRPAKELALLTDREREVLSLVAGGLTNNENAKRLFISPATARTHVSRTITKLGARDRTHVFLAYENRPGAPRMSHVTGPPRPHPVLGSRNLAPQADQNVKAFAFELPEHC
jgi:DNA-binding CsgD family transcriptional regulator